MAKSNDTTYYADATAKCTNCGSVYNYGSTIKELSVEICGNCHPFYTGKETLVDTAGRIEKFQARMSKVSTTGKSKKVKSRKQVQSIGDLIQDQPEVESEEQSQDLDLHVETEAENKSESTK